MSKTATDTQYEVRHLAVAELRVLEQDGEQPKIEGYAAVFNKLSEDLGGFRERVEPGAFTCTIKTDDIRALVDHDPSRILGRNRAGTLSLSEDDRGLRVVIKPPDTTIGRDTITTLKRGDVNGMSFGFRVKPGGQRWFIEDGEEIRSLSDVELQDVSVVAYPAYLDTDVAVRSLEQFHDSQAQNTAEQTSLDSLHMQLRLADEE